MKKLLILSMLAVAPAMFGVKQHMTKQAKVILPKNWTLQTLPTFAAPFKGRALTLNADNVRLLNAVVERVNYLTDRVERLEGRRQHRRYHGPYLEQPQS